MNPGTNKAQFFAIAGVVIICATIVVSVLILANSNIYIKNLGTSLVQDGKLVNTISVSGDGKVFAKPDMAEITVSVSELANTSSEALQNANTKVSQIIDVLKNNSIDPQDIQTSQFNISPEYDYTSGTATIKGQRATISLDIKVKKIDDKATKATNIIDQVSKIDNIQIGSINFDIEDKTQFFSQAREQAYTKAKQKADELAKYADVKLLKPVSVSDTTTDVTPIPYINASAAPLLDKSAGSSQISTGQLEVSVNVNVVFGIE